MVRRHALKGRVFHLLDARQIPHFSLCGQLGRHARLRDLFRHLAQNPRRRSGSVVDRNLLHHFTLFFQNGLADEGRDVTLQTRRHHLAHVLVGDRAFGHGREEVRQLPFELKKAGDGVDELGRFRRFRHGLVQRRKNEFANPVLVGEPVRPQFRWAELRFGLLVQALLPGDDRLFRLRLRRHLNLGRFRLFGVDRLNFVFFFFFFLFLMPRNLFQTVFFGPLSRLFKRRHHGGHDALTVLFRQAATPVEHGTGEVVVVVVVVVIVGPAPLRPAFNVVRLKKVVQFRAHFHRHLLFVERPNQGLQKRQFADAFVVSGLPFRTEAEPFQHVLHGGFRNEAVL